MAKNSPVIAISITADDKTKKGVQSAESSFEGLGKKVTDVGKVVGAFALTGVAGVGAFAFSAAKSFQDTALAAGQFANSAGLAVDDASRWLGVMSKWGVELGDIQDVFNNVASLIDSEDSVFKDLGIEISKTAEGTVDMDATMKDVVKTLSKIQDPAKRAAAASKFFGEEGSRQFSELIAQGADLETIFNSLGDAKVVDEEELEKAKRMQEGMASLKAKFDELQLFIGEQVVPAIAMVTEWLSEKLGPAFEAIGIWIREEFIPRIQELVATFKENWPEIKAAVEPVLKWFKDTVEDVWKVISALWETYGQTIMDFTRNIFGPIKDIIEGAMYVIKGIIDVVLGLLTGDWDKAWNGIKDIVFGIWEAIKGIVNAAIELTKLNIKLFLDTIGAMFGGAWNAITDAISGGIDALLGFFAALPGRMVGLFDGMFDGIKDAFKSAINWVIDKWNGFDFTIGGGSFMGKDLPKVTIGTPNIPQLAQGGIVQARPGGILARLGEGRYDEAVIPLRPGMGGMGNTVHYSPNIYMPVGSSGDDVVRAERNYLRRAGVLPS